jgi:hypothetical protein
MKKFEISEEDIHEIKLIFQDYISWHGRIHALDRFNEIFKSKPEIKYLSKEEVQKVVANNFTVPHLVVDEDGVHQTDFKELDIDNAIREICYLVIKGEVVVEGEITYGEDESDFWIGGTLNLYTVKDDIGEKLVKIVGKKVRIIVEVIE